MSKNTSTKAPKAPRPVSPQAIPVPEGFAERSGDYVGFWDEEISNVIQGVPVEAKIFDGNIEKNKPSYLITFRLTKDMKVLKDAESGEVVEAKFGDHVGVWGKPGMSALRNLCGVEVFMYCKGEKDTGKPNAMRVYSVNSATTGAPLPVTSDTRNKSKGVQTFLDGNIVRGS